MTNDLPEDWRDRIYDSLPLGAIKHMDFPQFCYLAEQVRSAVSAPLLARVKALETTLDHAMHNMSRGQQATMTQPTYEQARALLTQGEK